MYTMDLRTEVLIAFKDSGIEDYIVALNVVDQYIADRIEGITVADRVSYDVRSEVRSSYACGQFIYAMIELTCDVISFSESESELAGESDRFVEEVILSEMTALFGGYEIERIVYKVMNSSDSNML